MPFFRIERLRGHEWLRGRDKAKRNVVGKLKRLFVLIWLNRNRFRHTIFQ